MKEKKENIHKELEELSPFLSQLKRESGPEGFDVPPRYFQELPGEVMDRLRREPAARGSSRASSLQHFLEVLFRPKVAVALATVAVAVAAGIYLLAPRPAGAGVSSDPFASLTVEEVQAYINANLDQFDTELVIEMAASPPDIGILPGDELNGETLDQYLEKLLQEVDEETLEEML